MYTWISLEQRRNMQKIIGLKVLSSFQFPTKIICYDIAITIYFQDKKVYITFGVYIVKRLKKPFKSKLFVYRLTASKNTSPLGIGFSVIISLQTPKKSRGFSRFLRPVFKVSFSQKHEAYLDWIVHYFQLWYNKFQKKKKELKFFLDCSFLAT